MVSTTAKSIDPDAPITVTSIKALTLLSLKRKHEVYVGNHGEPVAFDEASTALKLAIKYRDEYAAASHLVAPTAKPKPTALPGPGPAGLPAPRGAEPPASSAPDGAAAAAGTAAGGAAPRPESHTPLSKMIDAIPAAPGAAAPTSQAIQVFKGPPTDAAATQKAVMKVINDTSTSSAAVSRRLASKLPRPVWHAPWRNYRVIAGHLGAVRCVAVDPAGNEWFATGAGDRTIKIWDLASGTLKLTLTGHIETVTGVQISDRHPYMFSCGLDKTVKCWDMEHNKAIRSYHGHLSGVYCLALHPRLDLLFTGGRDSVVRVWDMRTKVQAMVLSGHDQTVCSLLADAADPQIISGSHDSTIKLWDLRVGKAYCTLTNHKKSIRAMAKHPQEFAFASASAENIKKWGLPDGAFLHNMLSQQRAIINAMAVNHGDVMVTGGDNGSLWWWDWRSGHCFQQDEVKVQPGSMESEACVHATAFDASGSRLITCEGDKTIKLWKEVEDAAPATHPGLPFRPPKDIKRF